MQPIYMLKATWKETFHDSDYGDTYVCDTFDIIAISADKIQLEYIQAILVRGHGSPYWSETRHDELTKLYPGYDDMRETEYVIEDISKFYI